MPSNRFIARFSAPDITAATFAQAFVGLFFLVVIPKWQPKLIDYSTLDGSWQAVMAHTAFSGLSYGRDLVYNNGPFGWLREEPYWPGLLSPLIAWGIFSAVVLWVLCRPLLTKRQGSWLFGLTISCILVPCIVAANSVALSYFIPVFVLYSHAAASRRRLMGISVLSAIYLSLSALVYFPLFVVGTTTVVVCTLLHFARFRRTGILPWLYVGTLLVWWVVSKQKLAALAEYLSASIEITRGYEGVMSVAGPWWQVVGTGSLIILVVYLVIATGGGESKLHSLILAAGLSAVLFVAFKGSVVRHQTFRLLIPLNTVLCIALAQLAWFRRPPRSPSHTGRVLLVLVMATALGGSILIRGSFGRGGAVSSTALLGWPLRQAGDLAQLVRNPGGRYLEDRATRQSVRQVFPMPDFVGSIDYFGDRQGILLARPVDYRPRPVFQRYSAHTDRLAQMNGRHMAGEDAPENLVIDLTGFGNTLKSQLDPLSFLEILQRYDHVATHGKLVFATLRDRRPYRLTLFFETTAPPDRWVSVAEHSDERPIWIQVEAKKTSLATLAALLYKTPPLELELRYHDGGNSNFRFIEDVARAGFWLSPTIQNSRQFAAFMDKGFDSVRPNRVVSSFRIHENTGHRSWVLEALTIRAYRLDQPPDEMADQAKANPVNP